MSSYTYTGIVPYAAKYLWHGDMFNETYQSSLFLQCALTAPEYYEEEVKGLPENFDGIINGWRYIDDESVKSPLLKGDELIFNTWRKENHDVHLINTSEYAAGGYIELAACSASKEALKQFLSDMFPEYEDEIEEMAIIKQTL